MLGVPKDTKLKLKDTIGTKVECPKIGNCTLTWGGKNPTNTIFL